MGLIICGLPNAGKTSYSTQYDNSIHYDELKLTTRQRYEQICEIARTDSNAVVEGVFGERKRRTEIVEACHSNGGKAICVWIDTPVEVCLERERNYRNRPDWLVLAHAKAFEPPTLDEGWDEILIVRKEYVMKITLEEGVETTTETLEELTNGKGEDEDE